MVCSNFGTENYADQLEPEQAATIWHFIDIRKFRHLMGTTEFYFCRADLFPDEREGLPPEECLITFAYIRWT